MFNNEDPKTNGEKFFFDKMKEETKLKVLFDVGCRTESLFSNHEDIEVHYFDPLLESVPGLAEYRDVSYPPYSVRNSGFIKKLKENEKSKNCKFNSFGLSDVEEDVKFYINEQSFAFRNISMPNLKERLTGTLQVRRGDEYMSSNDIKQVDFLKIDTEGYEFNVIKGFGDSIRNVKVIQFEYGGTWKDTDIKLDEVVSYLSEYGFTGFGYLHGEGVSNEIHETDHYHYCNVACYNPTLMEQG